MAMGDGSLHPTRRAYLTALTGGIVAFAGCSRSTSENPTVGNRETTDPETGSSDETTATTATTATTTTTSQSTRTEIHPSYDTTEVRVVSPGDDLLGSVTAAIADTADLRYTGLSDTDSLPEDRGMLFVFDSVGRRTFVMREMDFGLDIVFADADGTITRIHHAQAPDAGGDEETYPGRGQYVLEVNLDWTTERGVSEGDFLEFQLPAE